MKKMVPALILLAVMGGGVAVWFATRPGAAGYQQQSQAVYYCPMHPTYTSDKPGDCPICNMKLVKREETSAVPSAAQRAAENICLMHNCPKMHDGRPCPMLVLAAPGEEVTCPVCGMHVTEAATAATPEGYAAVMITPQKQQLIGVKTAAIERRSLTKTIRATGTVAHDTELYQAQAEHIAAVQALQRLPAETSEDVRARAQRLVDISRLNLKHVGLSDALIDEVSRLPAPEHGLLVGGGGRTWIYASVYEYELPLLTVGADVQVDVPSAAGRTLPGVLRAIDPAIDPATRTARIRVIVDDADAVLKPEMYVDVRIEQAVADALVVPVSAVFHTGTRQLVFVDRGEGLFEPRAVVLGAAAEDWQVVTDGVTAGERVVTNGNFLIDSESRLKAALEGMAPSGGGGAHQHGP